MYVVLYGVAIVIGFWLYAHLSFQRRKKGHVLPPTPPKHWFPGVGHADKLMNKTKPFPILIKDWAEEMKTDLYMIESFVSHLVCFCTELMCE